MDIATLQERERLTQKTPHTQRMRGFSLEQFLKLFQAFWNSKIYASFWAYFNAILL
jgi:hypothetical protein